MATTARTDGLAAAQTAEKQGKAKAKAVPLRISEPRKAQASKTIIDRARKMHAERGGKPEAFDRAFEACGEGTCVPVLEIRTFKQWAQLTGPNGRQLGPRKGEKGYRLGRFSVLFCLHQVEEYDER